MQDRLNLTLCLCCVLGYYPWWRYCSIYDHPISYATVLM